MPVLTRFSNPNDPNTYSGRGLFSLPALIPFLATIVLPVPARRAFKYFWDFATLTGAVTINATVVSHYQEGDEIVMRFLCDGTSRTITWGTNFRPGVAATFVLGINQVGVVTAIFMDGKIHITSQTLGAP